MGGDSGRQRKSTPGAMFDGGLRSAQSCSAKRRRCGSASHKLSSSRAGLDACRVLHPAQKSVRGPSIASRRSRRIARLSCARRRAAPAERTCRTSGRGSRSLWMGPNTYRRRESRRGADAAAAPRHPLQLDRRVPPRVEQEHVLGSGQVQADAAALGRDQAWRDLRVQGSRSFASRSSARR
jgi:hypothetical protein